MAGTLQTGTLVDGQWMTTSVDVNTVLERYQERKQEALLTENDPIPSLGLLTQTVINSSVIRWIFPARVRGSEYRDVAFIGDNFVQIRRLDSTGHFHDICRKSDFGQRIRNACIIGSSGFQVGSAGEPTLSGQMLDGNGDVSMVDVVGPELIPPQFILLALESGDFVFLSARNVGMDVGFITSTYKVFHKGIAEPPGKHLKVDPSFRYVAAASSELSFAIYHLKSKEELQVQKLRGEHFNHIASDRHLHVRGVIHKMEFLYPAPDDPDHIILLLLVVRNGATAMHVYEWEAGQNLKEIRSNNLRGHPLPPTCRMPLLLIPLTMMSAMLIISGDSIMECQNILEGSPTFQVVPQPEFTVSSFHMGMGVPLWTAWTRPLRHPKYSKNHDNIYVAREDGLIAFFEVVSDSTVLVRSTIGAGSLESTVSTAFSNLELAPDGMDFLITGGDSCDGGSYLVAVDKRTQLVEPVSNWAPMIDFVTTARVQIPDVVSEDTSESSKRRKLILEDPDRVFSCTGRGSYGAVSEIRYGYEARVGLDIEGIHHSVIETWGMPLSASFQGNELSETPPSSLFLLAVGDESILLNLSADLREIEEVPLSSTWLDLKSRTLAALAYNGIVVQITEKSISISAEPLLTQAEGVQREISRTDYPSSQTIVAASIFENEIALIVIKDARGDLKLSALRVRTYNSMENETINGTSQRRTRVEVIGGSIPLRHYPDSISIIRHSDGSTYGIICAAKSGFNRNSDFLVKSGVLSLSAVVKIEDTEGILRVENPTDYWPLDQKNVADALGTVDYEVVPEACVSIASLRGPHRDPEQNELLLVGYRSGILVMVCYKMTSNGVFAERRTSRYPIGSTSVNFKTNPATPNIALICCDSKLWRVVYDCSSKVDPLLHRVWFTAVESPLHSQPLVDHVSILPQGLLLYSGNKLLVTSLDPNAKPVPRKMPLFGSPHRLLYSHRLEKIIVGVSQEGRSTIKILDPKSGNLVGRCVDSSGHLVPFPSGLGVTGQKILCLVEWEWKTSSTSVDFIILGTSDGSLVIYKMGLQDPTDSGITQYVEIHCAPFLEEHFDEPISAIVTCAKSFFFSVGQTVRWVTLDVLGGKLLTRAEYKLSSRVVSMSIESHWLNVLTVRHSLTTLLLVDKRKYPKCADQHGKLVPQFADETERDGLDQILASSFNNSTEDDSALIVVGDMDCTVAGLWYCKRAQSLVSSHKIIFEAELPISILKFRFGRTRPPWDRISKSSAAKNPYDGGQLLGMGIDGSLIHFSILEEGVWKLLRFLQNLVHRSSVMSHIPCQAESKPDVRTRHVDGETLRPYLNPRMLERLLMTDETQIGHDTENRVVEEFCSLVNLLPFGAAEPPERLADRSLESCLEEANLLLADLLRPVL